MSRTIHWFRDDLRVWDNPSLRAARDRAKDPGDVLGVYILDEHSTGIRPLGGAAKWWLHEALNSLREELGDRGIPLLIRSGDPQTLLPALVADTKADRVHWSRRYGGPERELDAGLKQRLADQGTAAHSFAATLLGEPWTIQTTTGGPYKVFTPFWRALSARDIAEPQDAPAALGDLSSASARLTELGVPIGDVESLALRPTAPNWARDWHEIWDPTETGAHRRLKTFVEEEADSYHEHGQYPDATATSRVSPYLRFGQLSPQQVWDAAGGITHAESKTRFRTQLGWRDFSWHLLYHFPELPTVNMRAEFDSYPWKGQQDDPETFRAWTAGRTGFPLADAGLRELWATGNMHNRVRMVTASLLVKNLGIDWRAGEAWFWDTLVDADAASNPVNWQWVAGCGADAAPYFRIFNPERQQKRFDPDFRYVRTWIPEYGTEDYPEPLVDLQESRQNALADYATITGKNT
ncbi:cryptochrome/photolyase family protein [Nesterenkonia natronophila]|uniref:Deoxyribodipyrimidine photo-lyase n=1 Tax=Nesterenkonia natronophila TaxID=2174932 RepID=A0A3A4FJ33_9MICC|nr:deoxyribodipyrimidine photo-lyase [Nesterenkonia natronophila]RJN32365.1 deoxyribodipyrimidine photo-lyase [Nesterenkonia natronophila]